MSGNLVSESFGYKQEFKRTLKMRDLVLFGLVFMSPVAAFTLYGFTATLSQGHMVLSYLVALGAMLFTASSYGKMVEAFPIAGSTFSYTQRAINPSLGFLSGWVMLLDYLFLPMFTLLTSAIFANAVFSAIPVWIWLIVFVILVTVVNWIGVQLAVKANFIMTFIMILAVLVFAGSAIYYIVTGDTLNLLKSSAIYNPDAFSVSALVSGAALAVVTYLGFDGITTLAEETEVKSNRIVWALVMACCIQTVMVLFISYLGAIVGPNFSEMSNPETTFFDITYKVGGAALQTFITLVVILSGIATAWACQSSASRMLYGMGRDRIIPSPIFAHLHSKYKTPNYNILIMAALTTIGALVLSLSVVSDLVAFGGLFGFTCVNLSVIVHFYFKKRSGRWISHLIVPAIGMAVCLYILFGISSHAKTIGLAWMGLGCLYLIIRSIASKDFRSTMAYRSIHKDY